MGKIGGGSWLKVVKRAFRSPTKDPHDHHKRSSRTREDHDQEEEEEARKRGKRRWIFKKQSHHGQQQETVIQHKCEANVTATKDNNVFSVDNDEALAVVMATTRAAKAAMVTAQAAVEAIRLTMPNNNYNSSIFIRETHQQKQRHFSAIAIQTAFRGYLARRALRALKGLVKLQALVRGHNVRKRAKMTLKCMQALARVQARVVDQRLVKRLSNFEGAIDHRYSLLSHPNCPTKPNRKSFNCREDHESLRWEDHSETLEHIEALLMKTKEAALKREMALSYAFTNKMWSSTDECEQVESEPEGNWSRKSKQPHKWDHITGRSSSSSSDHQYQMIIDPIKTVEIDTYRPCYNNYCHTDQYHSAHQRPNSHNSPAHQRPNSHNSPAHKAHFSSLTPSPSKPKFNNLHHNFHQSVTPRYANVKLERTRVTNNNVCNGEISGNNTPNYMADTASAKARSESSPKQRPSKNLASLDIGERISTRVSSYGSARKRLSFPVQGEVNDMVGPRRASVSYSRCSDSETSPMRNNHEQLRRWLR